MFRNVKHLINPKTFSKENNFILKHANLVSNPSSQFYKPGQDPKLNTPFELCMIANAISHQNVRLNQYKQLTNDDQKFQNFNQLVTQKQEVSNQVVKQYLHECHLVLSTENFDLPVGAYTSYLLACVQQNQFDLAFFEKYVVPKISDKLQYLDKQGYLQLLLGLEELLYSLNKVNYENQKFKDRVLNHYKAKNVVYQECEPFEWRVDQYQLNSTNYEESDNIEQYYQDSKNGAFLANYRFEIRELVQEFKMRILNRTMFRESRVQFEFKNQQLSQDQIKQIQ